MNVLDTSIANVSLPAIAGDLGVSPNQGTWVITSFAVANAIAVPLTGWMSQRFGQVRLVRAERDAVRDRFRAVRAGAEHGDVDLVSRAAGVRGGADDSAVADPAAGELSESAGRHRDGVLGHDDVDRAGGRAAARWLADRQPVVAVDLLHQHPGRCRSPAFGTWALYKERESTTRKLPIDAIGLALLVVWVGAMQIMLDLGKENDWFHSAVDRRTRGDRRGRLHRVPALGDDRRASGGRPEPVRSPQLLDRRGRATSVGYGLFFGSLVLLPLWLQQFMGYTATEAGKVLAPVGLARARSCRRSSARRSPRSTRAAT